MLRKLLIPAACVALLCGATAQAVAQELRSDRATYFTFSAPVALPTVTLPAGKYLFRVADSQVTRSIIQIYSADGSKLHAMVLTLPAIRDNVSDEPEVRFFETVESAPPAIATWWYPGMKTGWEFIYPRDHATRLAQNAKQGVLTTAQDVSSEEMKNAEIVRLTSSGQTPAPTEPAAAAPTGTAQRGEVATTTTPAQTTTPKPVTPEPTTPPATPPTTPPPTTTPPTTTPQQPPPPQPATPPPAQPPPVTTPQTPPPPPPPARTTPATPTPATPPSTPEPSAARSELPRTASATPLVALIGALALCVGVGLGFWRRKMA
jgi:LPXTG-motif cell wall-anchored protein